MQRSQRQTLAMLGQKLSQLQILNGILTECQSGQLAPQVNLLAALHALRCSAGTTAAYIPTVDWVCAMQVAPADVRRLLLCLLLQP